MEEAIISNLTRDIEERDIHTLYSTLYTYRYSEIQNLTQTVSKKPFITLKITMENKTKIKEAFNMTGEIMSVSELFE